MDMVRRIADAVLYEGYVLWPYRRSAIKNQQRWTFGGVYPRAHSAGRSAGDDPACMQTQCLVEAGGDARLAVSVRFLQVVQRQVMRSGADGHVPVDELQVGDERHLSWDEAVERELELPALRLRDLRAGLTTPIDVAAGSPEEQLYDSDGRQAGAVVRSWRRLEGTVAVGSEELRPGLHRVTVQISNESPWPGGPREDALRQTFCSTHTVLRVAGGTFVSLTDPPAGLATDAAQCRNEGTWPVLIGEQGERDTLLSSPIILSDYPQIAPESPGDLFDASEIDQMLVLNILSLTDAEKQEMRDTDPRTRAILERTEALSPEELMRLNGTIREFGMARR
jgi:hypothetical protein